MSQSIVTVFGGSGFIGRHVVRRLARQGAVVRVAVRDTEQALFLKTMGNTGQIVPVYADVTDPVSVAAALAGADQAVNLVGILSPWGKQTFERIHVDGAATVAAAAQAAGVRSLVQMSSLSADPGSASAYSKTKAAGEVAAKEAFENVTIVRPGVVMGAEDGFFNRFAGIMRFFWVLPVFGCPVMPKIILFGDTGPLDFEFYGDGGTRLQPVFVGDVAAAISAILDDPDCAGKTYELGGPRVYSFKQLMELLLRVTNRTRLLVPVPFPLASFYAWFLEKLPHPLLT
ncbi:MAG TPA: complex I NDUFA9 subunit family protein, partial [Rhodospirillales bacterium]|nr:complex I NDUFA9 subunit family protein [Rhodospirillales bacterium]